MKKGWYLYILASKRNWTLYIGVTNDLLRRIYEHKAWLVEWFTKKHDVHKLVYYEKHDSIEWAICKEKQMKKWNRNWKIKVIEKENVDRNDLYNQLIE